MISGVGEEPKGEAPVRPQGTRAEVYFEHVPKWVAQRLSDPGSHDIDFVTTLLYYYSMKNIRPGNIAINPLFNYVLSGEFVPPTDTLGRKHTLSMLGIATVLKGAVDEEHYMGDDSPSISLIYKPSWAPIESFVVCDRIPEEGDVEVFKLRAVTLYNEENDSLSIGSHDAWLKMRGRDLSVSGPLGTLNENLRLDDNLETTKSFITQSAQQFFDDL